MLGYICLNSAISKLRCIKFEWKSERLHQFSAVISNSSINLDAEAITKFSMLLQILLNGRVGDVSRKCFVIGIDL